MALGSGVFDASATVFYVLATRHGLFSLAVVITSLYPAMTVLLARVVLGERMRGMQRAAGASCAWCCPRRGVSHTGGGQERGLPPPQGGPEVERRRAQAGAGLLGRNIAVHDGTAVADAARLGGRVIAPAMNIPVGFVPCGPIRRARWSK